MKVLAKPIEIVAWFDSKGIPHPVRFRITNEDQQYTVIKVHNIYNRKSEKLAGNKMLVFECGSVIRGVHKRFQIKYELCSCKWILFKI